jgi:hypothetical protein
MDELLLEMVVEGGGSGLILGTAVLFMWRG